MLGLAGIYCGEVAGGTDKEVDGTDKVVDGTNNVVGGTDKVVDGTDNEGSCWSPWYLTQGIPEAERMH